MRSRSLLVIAVAVALTAGCSAAANGRTSLEATGYALVGSAKAADVTRDGRYLRTIGIDGVTLTGPDTVEPVSSAAHRLRRAAQRHGRKAVLLVSNYSNAIADFDEPLAHEMLTSPARRAAVVAALAAEARRFDGVQIDLESLEERDRDGLTAFAGELRAALPDGSLSMAFMASSNGAGYRARGYDLAALSTILDRMVLMAYDQHGPWSDAGPIGSLGWVRRELRYFAKVLPNRTIDLGVATYGYQWGAEPAELTVAKARRLAGGRARWSAKDGEWTAALPGGRTIWWSDRRSLAAREKIARRFGVHGVAIWEIGGSGPLR